MSYYDIYSRLLKDRIIFLGEEVNDVSAGLIGEEIQRLLIQAKEDDCFELLLLELTTGQDRAGKGAGTGSV